MVQDKFKNEGKVRKIGGKVANDYSFFKMEIESINETFFELFQLLGLTDDLDTIVEVLNDNLYNLKIHFINKVFRDMEKGKCPRYKFLSSNMKKKIQSLPPEEEEKIWKRETNRSLIAMYKTILEQYKKDKRIYYLETRHNKKCLEIFGKSLIISPSRIEIDGEKFIEIYTSFTAADESETKKLHEQAAASINRFFNGLEITHKELDKYFILEYGAVRIRPKSVNLEDYARLGYRGAKQGDGDSKK